MLPALLRYDLRQDSAFFERAHSWRSAFWTILVADSKTGADSDSPTPLQFAVIVKKTVASGVVRSELKRKVRQAIVEALPSPLPEITTPQAVVLIPRRKAVSATSDELREDLKKFFSDFQTE
jgi:ribonuclease P protein component